MYSRSVATLYNWSVFTEMRGGGDRLVISGAVEGHHGFCDGDQATPGSFVSFDSESLVGISKSGTQWSFDKDSFEPNGNAPSLDEAIRFIQSQ